MIEGQITDLGQIAYEARFRGMTLGARGAAPAWADLGPEGRAVWQRVADEVVAAAHDPGRTAPTQARAVGSGGVEGSRRG